MKTKDAIALFGNKTKLAQALGIHMSSVGKWRGDSPPLLRQYQLQALTAGRLQVEVKKTTRKKKVA